MLGVDGIRKNSASGEQATFWVRVSTYIIGLYAGDEYIGQMMSSRESPVVV